MQTKELQGKLWSAAPVHWTKFIEPTFIPMYLGALAKLDLDEETMLLDAGCGSGLFLSMVMPTGASIHGIDAAPGLLEISKRRLPAATLLLEDLESIPFNDETFDVVTGFNSFQYACTFANALHEAARVAKKGGRVVIGIWGKEKDCEAGDILKAVTSLLPPSPRGTPGPFALSEDGKVEAICRSVGLRVVLTETVSCPWQFSSAKDLQEAFLCTGPCVKAADIVGADMVKKVIRQTSEPFSLAEGVYYMTNKFTYFITEKI